VAGAEQAGLERDEVGKLLVSKPKSTEDCGERRAVISTLSVQNVQEQEQRQRQGRTVTFPLHLELNVQLGGVEKPGMSCQVLAFTIGMRGLKRHRED
jgi:hypothetical protein